MLSTLKDKKIIIFGKNGQVGSNLCDVLSEQNLDFKSFGSKEVDFSKTKQLKKFLENLEQKPDIIINCVAYTKVDEAEDNQEECQKINVEAVSIIAEYCDINDIILVNYSSDYVYSGIGEDEFIEDAKDNLAPQNIYGRTKLEADLKLSEICDKYLIFRTSWVYNHSGNNFVKTMLKLFKEKEDLKVVYDQIGSPTYAYDIAEQTLLALNNGLSKDKFPSGIYNLCGKGFYSWYDFAKLILKNAKNNREFAKDIQVKQIESVPSSQFKTKAKRPLNSRMSQEKIAKTLNIEMPKVETSLNKCLDKILK